MIAYVDEYGNITSTPPDLTQKKAINLEDIAVGVPRNATPPEDPIHKGFVSFFDTSKGYGFIKDYTTNTDVFFHIKSAIDEVNEKDKVLFEVVRGDRGLNAINVKLNKE